MPYKGGVFLELALGIFKKTRFLFALIAAGAAGVAIRLMLSA